MCREDPKVLEKGILLMDRACLACEGRHRYTAYSRRKGKFCSKVFVSDGTVREVTGYTDQRREPPFWAHIYGGGVMSGTPTLSEPKATYDLVELKAEVLKRKWYGIGETRKEFKQKLDAAASFDEIFALCDKW